MQFETSGPSQWQFKCQCNANAIALPIHDWRWIGSISRGLAQVQNRKGTPFEQFKRVLLTNQRAGF